MAEFVLALDQGTTSSRAILFRRDGQPAGVAQSEFEQLYPAPAHVEHDPETIWTSQLNVARQVLQEAGVTHSDLAAVGITNQRETTLLWERDTGRPIANAIVWQSRITTDICQHLKDQGLEETFRQKTGLVIDPYFSGTKIKYLLDNTEGLRTRAEKGEILFGTVDSFLVWRLTGGKQHITDYSNASRTLLYNIHELNWDDELLKLLDVPRAMLPEVRPSSQLYAQTDPEIFGGPVPIAGIAGDQQAATFGQACLDPGTAKNTYGTGCFLLMNTGTKPVSSQHGLITTIGWGIDDQITYCLEGSIFVAGAVVQWLRDGLEIIGTAPEIEQLAAGTPHSDGVYFVPAFVGLGAPYWNPQARGTIIGMTRSTTRGHIARAALESIAYQTRDVLEAMQQDAGLELDLLKVDGGVTANNLAMQFQADLLGTQVQRPLVQETTALGAAYLAGLAVGFWDDQSDLASNWKLDREFTPTMEETQREQLYDKWKEAVQRSLNWSTD